MTEVYGKRYYIVAGGLPMAMQPKLERIARIALLSATPESKGESL